jgi:hypothetical protein
LTGIHLKSSLKKQYRVGVFFPATVRQETLMILRKTPDLPDSGNHPVTEKYAASVSEISGAAIHPARRASDNCPLSRIFPASDYPPTSPKMHELRERNSIQPAANIRSGSRIKK